MIRPSDLGKQPVGLEQIFVNGRYVRYVHMPEDVDIVTTVNTRVLAQNESASTHKRQSDVIRESTERRERLRNAQLERVASAMAESGVAVPESHVVLRHFVPGAKPPSGLTR